MCVCVCAVIVLSIEMGSWVGTIAMEDVIENDDKIKMRSKGNYGKLAVSNAKACIIHNNFWEMSFFFTSRKLSLVEFQSFLLSAFARCTPFFLAIYIPTCKCWLVEGFYFSVKRMETNL